MKLLRCHIENFGKLSDFNYEFKDGLNIIKEKNGFGKTTFANFIKSMFYGLESKRNTKVLVDRKKYEPWQGGAYGGTLEFIIDEKKYKIERFFGKKESDDIFKLYDLTTNLESKDYSKNLGEEIFKLNKEGFERSTFISGQNIKTSMNDSINAKLGNILESENDVNTSDKALKILDDKIKIYKKTGGRGVINEYILRKTELEKKVEQSKLEEQMLLERKKQNEKINEQLKINLQKKEELEEELTNKIKEETRIAKLEQYKVLKLNVEESKKNLEKYRENIVQDNDLKQKIEFNTNKLERSQNMIKVIEKEIKQKKLIERLDVFVFIFFIITFLCMFRVNKTVAYSIVLLIMVSLAVLITLIIMLNKKKKIYIEKKQEINHLKDILETLNSVYEKQKDEQKTEVDRLQSDYELKLRSVQLYEGQNNMQEILNLSNLNSETKYNIDREEIEKQIKILNEQINSLNDEKSYNQNQIELKQSNLETVLDVENELDDVKQKINDMQEKCNILEETKKYLEIAKQQFSSHYLKKMKENFIKNIELINGNPIKADLDVNLNVKILEKGSDKEIDYFSTGYTDLIYICMRISLINSLFENEKPFVILDDPFVNLDESKTQNAIKLIKKISDNYQMIYFICHESRI